MVGCWGIVLLGWGAAGGMPGKGARERFTQFGRPAGTVRGAEAEAWEGTRGAELEIRAGAKAGEGAQGAEVGMGAGER